MSDEIYNSAGDLDLRYKKSEQVRDVMSKIAQLQEDITTASKADLALSDSRIQKLRIEKSIVEQIQSSNENIVANRVEIRSLGDDRTKQAMFENQQSDELLKIEKEILQVAIDKKLLEDPEVKAKTRELELLKQQQSLLEDQNKLFSTGKEIYTQFLALATDPKIAATVFGGVMLNNASEFATTMLDAGSNIGMARDQAIAMGTELSGAAITGFFMLQNTKDLADAYSAINVYTAGQAKDAAAMASNAAGMAHSLGISGELSGKLYAMTSQIDGSSAETSKATLQTVENLARGANVPIGKVMADVAASADHFATFSFQSMEAMGKAAIEAAKMGTTMDQLASTAEGLLDIDNARTKAMQLSVLLNRNINIDKAQQLAFEGDIAGATAEMLNQLGGITAWNKMNYYQKKEAAALLNMSTGDMQKQLHLQQGLTETGEEQPKALGKSILLAKDIAKFAKDNVTTLASGLSVIASIQKMEGLGFIKKSAMWIKEKAHALWMKTFGGGSKATSAVGALKKDGTPDMRFAANKLKPATPAALPKSMPAAPKTPGGATPGKGFKVVDALKAAAAMLIIAAAIFIFAKAAKEFGDDINWKNVLIGSAILVGLGIAAALIGKMSSQVIQGALAMGILGIALIPAAFAFSLLAGVDPSAMITFAASLALLGLAAAGLGFLLGPIALGSIALLALGIAIIPASLAMKNITGVDLVAITGFGAGLVVIATAIAGMGLMLPFIALGAVAAQLLGFAIEPAVSALSGLVGVDPATIIGFGLGLTILGASVTSMGLLLPLIGLGALGILAISQVLPMYISSLAMIPQGLDMTAFAAGTAALGLAGITLIPGAIGFLLMSAALTTFAGALLLLLPLLPVIATLGALGIPGFGIEGKEKKKEKEEDPTGGVIGAKLDKLIQLVEAGGDVLLDGKKVGKALSSIAGASGT